MVKNKLIALIMASTLLMSTLSPFAIVIGATDINLALDAAVTASSQYPGGGYNAVNARSIADGVEWAGNGEAKPWIQYDWSTPVDVGTLYVKGRNSGESPTKAKITLSDATNTYEYVIDSISYGANATFTTFPLDIQRKNIIRMKFETIESTGGNVGLSGLEVISAVKMIDQSVINRALSSTVQVSSQYPGGSYDGKYAKSLDDGLEWSSNSESKPWIQYTWNTPVDVGMLLVKGRSGGEYPTQAKIIITSSTETKTITVSGITYKTSDPAKVVALPEMMNGVTSIRLETIASIGTNVGLSGFEVYTKVKAFVSEKIWSSAITATNYDAAVPLTIGSEAVETPFDGTALTLTPGSTKGLGSWTYISGSGAVDFTEYKSTSKVRFFAKATANSGFGFALTNQNGNAYNVKNFDVTTQWKEFILPLNDFVATAPSGDTANNTQVKEVRLIDNGMLAKDVTLSLSSIEIWSGEPEIPTTPPLTAEKVYESNFIEGPFGSYTGDGKVTWGITSIEKYLFKKAYQVNVNENGWLGGTQNGIALVDYTGTGHTVIRNISELMKYGKVRFFAKTTRTAAFEYFALNENQNNSGNKKTLNLSTEWQEYIFSVSDLVTSSGSNAILDNIKFHVFRDKNGALHKDDKLFISMLEVWTKTPPTLEMPVEQPSTSPYDANLKTVNIWRSGTQLRGSWNNESCMQSIINESISGFKDYTIKFIKNPEHPEYFLKTGRGILFTNEIEDLNFDYSSGFIDETNILKYQPTGTLRFFMKVPRAGMKFTVSICNGNLLDENGNLLATSWAQGSVTVTVPKANEYVEMQVKLSDFIENNKNVDWTKILGVVIDGVSGQKEGDADAVNIGDEFYIRQPEIWTDTPKAFGVLDPATTTVLNSQSIKDSVPVELTTISTIDMLSDRYQGFLQLSANAVNTQSSDGTNSKKLRITAIDNKGISGATKELLILNSENYKVAVCELVGALDLSNINKIKLEAVGGDINIGNISFVNGILREAQVIKKPDNSGGSFGSGDFVFGWDDEFDWDGEFGWKNPSPEYVYVPKMERVKKLVDGTGTSENEPTITPRPTIKPKPIKSPNSSGNGNPKKNNSAMVLLIVIIGAITLITACGVLIYNINRRTIK